MEFKFFKKSGEKPAGPRILRGKIFRAAKKAPPSLTASIEPIQNQPQKPGLFKFTMMILYKNLYLLGITLLRRRLRLGRRLRRDFAAFSIVARRWLKRAGSSLRRFFDNFIGRSTAPFVRIRRTYIEVKPGINAKRAAGKFPLTEYSLVLETVFRLIFKIFATVFNYTAPVAAAVVFVMIVGREINEPRVYTVQYKGEIIGYVENESDFNAATQDVRSRVTTDGEGAFDIYSPHFELMTLTQFRQRQSEKKIPPDADLLEQDALADKLISMSGSAVEDAYGLYIDNTFYGAVLDKDIILDEFDSIKRRYYTGKPDEQVRFAKSIRLKPGLYLKNSIVDNGEIIGEITRNENSEELYTVKSGDTPTGIADKTGVPYDVLKELNPDIEDKLVEGMEVITQVARPFLTMLSTYTDIVEEDVPYDTVETQNATYAKGYRDVYQTGENGKRLVTYSVSAVDGMERDRVELSAQMIKYPVDERVTVGINNPPPVIRPPTVSPGSGSSSSVPSTPPQVAAPAAKPGGFIWPVGGTGGRITTYLNGYWGHTGIDIARAGGAGTPILASASGTVVVSKSNIGGYGRYIVIDHGNGYQTLYAHNSALYASVGDRVSQGQVIAAMGSTGNSFGVHCHFEVRLNGKVMNPVNYVGSR